MATRAIQELISDLPWRMRESVEGYVDAVGDALPQIQQDAGVQLSETEFAQFLFIVAIRRIWAAVNAQYWIIGDTLTAAKGHGLSGFQVGRDAFGWDTPATQEAVALRQELHALLVEQQIAPMVEASSLADVLRLMRERR
jgi:hypothetical protein